MHKIILHTKPTLGRAEAAAARATLLSGMINDGGRGAELVRQIAATINAAGGTVTSTGTHGILLALRALGICSPEHRVAIPDFSCRAVYDAVRMSGATAVFVDVDESLTMPASALRPIANTLKAIVLPHLFGQPADIKSIISLGVPIIEDCAHSPGAYVGTTPVGSFGQFAVYSFEGSKYVTAGEGGAVIGRSTNDVKALLDAKMQGEIASQCRLSDVISAVALAQWHRLPQFINYRKKIAKRYQKHLRLERIGGSLINIPIERDSIYYRFIALVNVDKRDQIIAAAEREGVLIRHPIRSGCLSKYLPGIAAGPLNVSADVDSRIISLPIYPSLTNPDQDRVISVMNKLA